MKLETAPLNVTRHGTIAEAAISIAATAKAFDILSSKVYTDVPLAIVRELSTNASDSHTESGNPDRQFVVHLPNALEPFFSIRDFGTGMSEDAISDVYTVMFASTRSSSDDYTGAFGIGSKTPFAYTDQFRVSSYVDGKCRIYSMFKSEDGCPKIAKLGEWDTSEPNGIEINVPVKQTDYTKFAVAAKKVYQYFQVRPIINGAEIKFDNNEVILSTDSFTLCKLNKHDYAISGHAKVVMGQVAYPIDGSREWGHAAPLMRGIHANSGYSLILNMPNGSVSFAASREELHYSEKTIKAVTEALVNAQDAIRKDLMSRVDAAKSELDKFYTVSEFDILGLLKKKLAFPELTDILAHTFPNQDELKKALEKAAYAGYVVGVNHGSRKCSVRQHFQSRYYPPYESRKSLLIVEEDERLRPRHKERLYHYIASLSPQIGSVLVFKINDRAKFLSKFGEPDVKVSELPAVPTDPNKPVKLKLAPSMGDIRILSIQSGKYGAWGLMPAGDSIKSGSYYVERNYNVTEVGPFTLSSEDLRVLMENLGIKGNVYGITKSKAASLAKRHGLVSLIDTMRAAFEKHVKDTSDKNPYLILLRYGNMKSPFVGSSLARQEAILYEIKDLSAECKELYRAYGQNVIRLAQRLPEYRFYDLLSNAFGISVNPGNIKDPSDAFGKKYPLISSMPVAFSNTNVDEVIEEIVSYIKFKENK